jgi:hypothetical protein
MSSTDSDEFGKVVDMPVERVVGMARNKWTASIGIDGRHGPEHAVGKPTPPELPEEVWINQPKSEHEETGLLAGPEASDREAGAQFASRAKSEASLDASEHLATLKRPLDPADKTSIFLPKFEPELCQSC